MRAAVAEDEVYRLFFALVPAEPVRVDIARALGQVWPQLPPPARRIPSERWHLTLAFLGSFGARPSALVERALVVAGAMDSASFTLSLDHLGHFGGRTRVLWLGPSAIPGELAALRGRLVGALQAAGVAVDRPQDFAPHLTIARGVERRPVLPTVAPVDWPITDFALLLSHQDRGGLAYETLHRWALGTPR